jgi:uncharacterized protein YciI
MKLQGLDSNPRLFFLINTMAQGGWLHLIRNPFAMFIISLNYIVPLEKLDLHMTDHVKFLRKYYKKNVFVVSGRKVPRTGGIILAIGKSKEEIEKIVREDPFHIHKLAEFTITEFLSSQYHPELKNLLTGSLPDTVK